MSHWHQTDSGSLNSDVRVHHDAQLDMAAGNTLCQPAGSVPVPRGLGIAVRQRRRLQRHHVFYFRTEPTGLAFVPNLLIRFRSLCFPRNKSRTVLPEI